MFDSILNLIGDFFTDLIMWLGTLVITIGPEVDKTVDTVGPFVG